MIGDVMLIGILKAWGPSITSTSLLAFSVWLGRNWITARLTKSIQHEYDIKLANLSSELKKSEEAFKGEIKTKELQIESLRQGVLSNIASRQAILYQRKVEAVEKLWEAVTSRNIAKNVSKTLSGINYEVAKQQASADYKTQEMFEMLAQTSNVDKQNILNITNIRPFLSIQAWAYFSAYDAITSYALIKLTTLRVGLDTDFADMEPIIHQIVIALPHQKEYVEKYGHDSFHYLLEELEGYLLIEIGKILNGEDDDKATLDSSALIMRLTTELVNKNNKVTEQLSKDKPAG
jgi:hypothetical protein